MDTLKQNTAKGLFWGGLSNSMQQFLNLMFGIFLARMLSQEDYGVIGMLTIFSALATALQNGGFISAINRLKTVTHEQYNSVFWTSVSIGLSLYILLFLSAPFIASFYGIPELKPLSRYLFLGFLVASFGVAPGAYLFRNMKVREMAILSITSILISGIVGVGMAAANFSYWGLATQNFVCILVGTIMSFHFSGWHPTLSISFTPVRQMIGFSSKLIITSIFNIVNGNVFSVILGKMYSPHDVGNYTQANKWNNMGSSLIGGMLMGVSQPVFAKTSNDKERQKKVFRKLLRFTAFVSFPAMFGLALVAKEFIVILLTEKWIESALLMQMLCIAGAFTPISSLFSNMIITRGHSTTYMWCTIGLCVLLLIAAILAAPHGINKMIQVYVIINIAWLFIWHFFTRREIDLRLMELLKDIIPYLALSLLFVFLASIITKDITNIYLLFIAKVLFVSLAYCISLWLLGSTIFKEFITFIRTKKI